MAKERPTYTPGWLSSRSAWLPDDQTGAAYPQSLSVAEDEPPPAPGRSKPKPQPQLPVNQDPSTAELPSPSPDQPPPQQQPERTWDSVQGLEPGGGETQDQGQQDQGQQEQQPERTWDSVQGQLPQGEFSKRVAAATNVPSKGGPPTTQLSASAGTDLDSNLEGVLKGQGQTFISAAQQYNLDPKFLAAIAMFESGRGTSNKARNMKNISGQTVSGNPSQYRTFNSVEDSIYALAQNLRTNYFDKGINTIPAIATKYAPPNAENDPGKTNTEWPGSVTKFYKAFGGSDVSGAGTPPTTQKVSYSNLANAAEGNLGMDTTQDPGTSGGVLACADAVSRVLKSAGYKLAPTNSTVELYKELKQGGWQEVNPNTPGAIVVSPSTGTKHGHTGIVGSDGKTIYSNSSKDGKWEANYTTDSWSERFGDLGVHAFIPGKDVSSTGGGTQESEAQSAGAPGGGEEEQQEQPQKAAQEEEPEAEPQPTHVAHAPQAPEEENIYNPLTMTPLQQAIQDALTPKTKQASEGDEEDEQKILRSVLGEIWQKFPQPQAS
jgi:mannosyl-glycoprotein endo-beta-N-acetylglucosaminidase